jgi:hypothetical protein
MEGFYGWGNTCGESYRISTNLGELHACVREGVTNVSYLDENVKSAQDSEYSAIFTVSNDYSKEEVRKLMEDLVIVK